MPLRQECCSLTTEMHLKRVSFLTVIDKINFRIAMLFYALKHNSTQIVATKQSFKTNFLCDKDLEKKRRLYQKIDCLIFLKLMVLTLTT